MTDPESIRETVMSNVHGKQEQRPERRLFGERFVGDKSIFVNKGDAIWRRSRKAYNKYFSRVHMKRNHEDVKIVAGTLCEEIGRLAPGTEVDMNTWLNLAACDVIGRVAFNWDIGSVSRGDTTFAGYLHDAFTGVALATGVPLSRVRPMHRARREEAVHAVRELRVRCADQICAHKENILHHKGDSCLLDDNKEATQGEEPCLLDEILALYPRDIDLQVDEMLAMFVAGQETVAHVITFALCHMMRDAALVELVEDEVKEYMGDPTFESLAKLRQVDNLMKETLRHYAPVPGLRRILSRDLLISGHVVPAGAEIVHAMILYAHMEETWGPEHSEFKPQRFEEDRHRHPHAFIPFGLGPRACIGKDLARIEFKTILAFLIDSFEFTPLKGEEIRAVRSASLKPLSGYMCYIKTSKNF